MRVIEVLRELFCRKYGCEPEDVEMAARLDELNLAPHEREDMALVLSDLYSLDMSAADAKECDTVEDVVAFVEDRLIEREGMNGANGFDAPDAGDWL